MMQSELNISARSSSIQEQSSNGTQFKHLTKPTVTHLRVDNVSKKEEEKKMEKQILKLHEKTKNIKSFQMDERA